MGRTLQLAIIAVALLSSLLTLLLRNDRPETFPVETGFIESNLSSPILDVAPRGPLSYSTDFSRMIRDDTERMVIAFDESGAKDELVVVDFTYPAQSRQGDEGQILFEVTARNSQASDLSLEVSSDGLKVQPASLSPIPIAGKVHVERRLVVSTGNIGNKTFVVSASLTPSRNILTPGAGHINVLPPLAILGIPRPYLDAIRSLASLIGVPGLTALLVSYWFSRRKPTPSQASGRV